MKFTGTSPHVIPVGNDEPDPVMAKIVKKHSAMFRELKVPAKRVLLREGARADRIFFIRDGCLRMWFNNGGKDVTFQFFFEGQAVSSIDSFSSGGPSLFSIGTLEPSVLVVVSKKDFTALHDKYPVLRERMNRIILARMQHYATLFLSRIKDTPRQRYLDLLQNHPAIIERVPQRYIASYLGITPVSLSRIRGRL